MLCSALSSFILVQSDLFIACSDDVDADLDVTSDRRKVIALWVGKSQPLMVNGMLILEIDIADIDVITAYKLSTLFLPMRASLKMPLSRIRI